MKEQYKGKTIAVIGASVIEHGKQFYYIRSYMQQSKDKCYLYNRGTGGNRAVMFPYLFDEEIKELDVDYVAISYGVNDMGIWLYDNLKPVTDELLAKRKARDDEYFESFKKAIETVKAYGAIPIVMSPSPVNELLVEKENIETLADNDEKEDNLKPSFYTRATFRNINQAIKGYVEKLKIMAEEMGAEYMPIFENVYPKTLKQADMFCEDGVHYNANGYKEIAKVILEYLGCENIPNEFKCTPENDEIEKLEQLDRHAGYIVRATPYNGYFGQFTDEEMQETARKIVQEQTGWYADYAKLYLEHYKELPKVRAKIRQLTEKL
ncbi:MAG: hypothetical protein IJB32_00805 [Clostridia bacterium]|nr:hypothetical protein [Clostridia bacterium]